MSRLGLGFRVTFRFRFRFSVRAIVEQDQPSRAPADSCTIVKLPSSIAEHLF